MEDIRADPIAKEVVEFLQIMQHPVRWDALRVAATEKCCISGLARHYNIPQPTMSRHVKALREKGLVRSRKGWVEVQVPELERLLELTVQVLHPYGVAGVAFLRPAPASRAAPA